MIVFIKWLGVLFLCILSIVACSALGDYLKIDIKWFSGWIAASIYFNLCFKLKGKL